MNRPATERSGAAGAISSDCDTERLFAAPVWSGAAVSFARDRNRRTVADVAIWILLHR